MDCVPGGSRSSCKCFSPGKMRSFLAISFLNLLLGNIPKTARLSTYKKFTSMHQWKPYLLRLLDQLVVDIYLFETARITRMPTVILIMKFLSRQFHINSINNNYIISAATARVECRFMLATQNVNNLTRKASKNLTTGIHQMPKRFCKSSIHHLAGINVCQSTVNKLMLLLLCCFVVLWCGVFLFFA